FCKQYEKNILVNDRKILNGLELDIVIPEKKIAIEYNGLFHHIWRPNESSFSARKDKNYHLFKTEECERQGYQLIHIFSDDWKNNNELIKSMILNKLGLTPKRIYARNCE